MIQLARRPLPHRDARADARELLPAAQSETRWVLRAAHRVDFSRLADGSQMKTQPYEHQLAEWQLSKYMANRALWWDQGTGKTKVIIDTASELYREGKIDALVIAAPRGVEGNWILDELPTHLDDDINWKGALWNTGKRHTKKHKAMVEEMLAHDGLKVLAISYHGIMVRDGAVLVRKMLEKFRCLYVADESTAFKTPNIKTTKRILASSKYATYRRVLNGTPVEDSPFDLYTQVKFVDPNIWLRRGIQDFTAFKTFFGIWEKRYRGHGNDRREYPALVQYRNMEILTQCMYEAGSRVLKEDVLPDLPEKTFTKIYFELTAEQRKVCRELATDLISILPEEDAEVSAELAIVRQVRFQQITSGFVPADDEAGLIRFAENPRLQALASALDTVPDHVVIWAKYTQEIDDVAAILEKRKLRYGIYDGRTNDEERTRIRKAFQAGDLDVFLAKPSAAGKGLTLTRANTVIYYSNIFSGDYRKQSEDRVHRIGQKRSVRYIDLVGRNTVDEDIIEVLRGKRLRSSIITGDTLRSWL